MVPCESFNGRSLEITPAPPSRYKKISKFDKYYLKIRTCLINERFLQMLSLNPIKITKRFYE